MKSEQNKSRTWRWLALAILIAACGVVLIPRLRWISREGASSAEGSPSALAAAAGGTTAVSGMAKTADVSAATPFLTEKFGIEIDTLHLAVGGTRVDFRYKVVDSLKATQLTNWLYRAYLLDSAGKPLQLPHGPVAGPVRQQSGQMLRAGSVYSHFFPNPAGRIKPGDRVTFVLGDFRADRLLVQ